MAISEDIRIKVRIYYETHSLSTAKVEEYFHSIGYDEVKKKTMESWMASDKKTGLEWIKNRYASLSDAVDSMVEEGVLGALDAKAKEVVKAALVKEHGEALSVDVLDAHTEQLSKQMIYDVLSKHSMGAELATNLNGMKEIVSGAPTMGNRVAYHQSIINTWQTVHGKTTTLRLEDPNATGISADEIPNLSTDDLKMMYADMEGGEG